MHVKGLPAGRSKVGGVKTLALALAWALALAGVAQAQDTATGRRIFEAHCASCHGVSAEGDGWLAKYLGRRPMDLGLLSDRYGGTFPEELVRTTIDGRREIALHGPRDMPVWGDVFKHEYGKYTVAPPPEVTPEPARFPPAVTPSEYAAYSIEALARYLREIQK